MDEREPVAVAQSVNEFGFAGGFQGVGFGANICNSLAAGLLVLEGILATSLRK